MSLQSRPIALLQRYSLVLELFGTVSGLVLVWCLLDLDGVAMGGAAVGITAATIWPHIRRRYGINRGWGKLLPGVGLSVLGAYAFTDTTGNVAIKAAFLVVGAWLTLDAVYDLRSGAGRTEPGAPDHMDRFGDAAIVGQALEDGPKTVAELTKRVDLPRTRVEDAIVTLQRVDAVERRGERYASRLDDRSLTDALRNESGRARDRIGGLPDRITRPFRLFT